LQATVLMFLPPSALLVYGALSLESGGHRAPQWLARIGDGSYSLYLVHILVLHAVYRVLRGHVGASTPWPTLVLLYVALVAGACVVAYVFRRYVEQPLSSRARKLLFAWSARLPSFGR
jgi:peptidoglycan/LPS O-acetylase OafA/YrhL